MFYQQEVRKQLAESLKKAKSNAKKGCVLRTSDLTRSEREHLTNAGFLKEVIRGWYLLTSPGHEGGSTAWYGGYWPFLSVYLKERFGEDGYRLSPESSIDLQSGDTRIPKQLIVLTKKATNTLTEFPHGTSIFFRTTKEDLTKNSSQINGVNVLKLEYALSSLAQSYYSSQPENVEICVNQKRATTASLTRALLELNSLAAAERTVGALKYSGKTKEAQEIFQNLTVSGFNLKDINPFSHYIPQLNISRPESPFVSRIKIMWKKMRADILNIAPPEPGISKTNKDSKIKVIQEAYQADAYNSLSIEGYHVTPELIHHIKTGDWNPDLNPEDSKHIDALAAKGYQDAFNHVIDSVVKVLDGKPPAEVLESDLQIWYRALFAPFAQSGIFKTIDIAGFRNQSVFIKQSRHIPPKHGAVSECMTALFDLLSSEPNSFVRAILGHFIFVYIHPYSDGNGRIGRFILNLMLISGGYNWTIIRNSNRAKYMDALEQASVEQNIRPFAEFILSEHNQEPS